VKNHDILKFVLLIIAVIVLSILFFQPFMQLFENRLALRQFVRDQGLWGPIVLIVIFALQVIIVPLPGQLAGLAGGFLYGILIGTGLTVLGTAIGSYAVFWLSRRYGRPFVEHIVDKDDLERYDKKINSSRGVMVLFMMFLLPMFPDDLICYIAGLTKIRMRTLVLISTVGRLPGFLVLSMVGSGVAEQNSLVAIVVFAIAMAASITVYFFREKLQALLSRRFGRWIH
jgi:uncharacterized membrane protein YdjX (TVP38/TMEM64 family)